jgi:hypothetical protein
MRKEEVHVLLLPLRRKGRILYPCSLWERNASQEYFASLKASRGRRMLVSVLKTLLFNNHVLRRLLGFKHMCCGSRNPDLCRLFKTPNSFDMESGRLYVPLPCLKRLFLKCAVEDRMSSLASCAPSKSGLCSSMASSSFRKISTMKGHVRCSRGQLVLCMLRAPEKV